ncbi:MAG: hypothetical protein COW04_12930 [Deltaproteobacteria bacterium CG12_big_fil_rev_8_21_14_0_65_43_10]|nr:MAG: hypothetical protein COW04_12930 [Deltaproteobacteria bacterium CG12_big_fil_rev_8_21_14_0_65_43_10]PIU86414.1 MAG: hypothetical protein COS67_02635 [Deltaproteobacteria bacterium CG06_land_8_20_14_3_00_44_19]PIX25605.1 MAG: hypothetical protein COZ68_03660 [Deltaproteobacteria bacterium CG_4_8_14_3_um_filter_43_13]PIZ20034.1 MAG: hypothetical protein COY50_06950 [Deltaproteobacteria bacterium CG_4_10_14_0_8_um_filter_43_12]PJB46563.1 MAG: hypothetical protein CO106_00135 [Deltaproteoba
MPSLSHILEIITNHPHISYFLIFLISLSESLAFVGLMVPGTVLMFGIGAVVATGSIALKPTLIAAIAGAITGDGISYWLGHHYQQRLVNVWPFSRYPQMLVKGDAFFRRHGGKSVLFGRFVGPVRPVIPVVAGMLGMGALRFTIVNVFSAIGWAFAYILPGVFFGTSLALAGRVSVRLTVLLILVVCTIWIFVWLCRSLVLFVGHFGPRWLASLEDWITADAPAHGVMLPLKRFLSFLFLRQKGEEFLLVFLVLALLFTGWGFLGVLQDVLAGDPLVQADQAVYHFFQSLRTPWGDRIFVVIMELGDGLLNSFIAGVVFIILLLKRCYRTAVYWPATLIVGACLVQLVKWAFHLPGPVALYNGISVFGFPSGHAAMSIVIYGFLTLVIAKGIRNGLRWGVFAPVFLFSFIIGFSRLYLGVDWLSDVLGGFLLALTWTALAGIFYISGRHDVIPRRLLGIVTLFVFFTVGFWHVADRHRKDILYYTPRSAVQVVGLETWLKNGWGKLPAWRIDLGGEREQPLAIQWAGSPECLAEYLVLKGWHRPPAFNLRIFLGMLSPNTTIQDLPLLPHLHDGRFEKMLLVRDKEGERWVFRLWPTDIQLKERAQPLWIGTISIQKKQRIADLVSIGKEKNDFIQPLELLSQILKEGFRLRMVYRKSNEIHGVDMPVALVWDGRAFLDPKMLE